jgi:hypothetical protein
LELQLVFAARALMLDVEHHRGGDVESLAGDLNHERPLALERISEAPEFGDELRP